MVKPQLNYAAAKDEVVSDRDLWYTPAYALTPLLPYLYDNGLRTVWESAAGEGHLTRSLEAAGFQVASTDIRNTPSAGQLDYFSANPGLDYDVEVTNPPFSLKYRWLEKACERGKPFALLMPGDVLFAAKGQALIKRYDLEFLVPDKRIDFIPLTGKSSSANVSTSWVTRGLNVGQRVTFVTITKPSKRRQPQGTIYNGTSYL